MISIVDEDRKEGELQVAQWKEPEARNSLFSAKPTLIHSQILAQLDSIAKIAAYATNFKIWTFRFLKLQIINAFISQRDHGPTSEETCRLFNFYEVDSSGTVASLARFVFVVVFRSRSAFARPGAMLKPR